MRRMIFLFCFLVIVVSAQASELIKSRVLTNQTIATAATVNTTGMRTKRLAIDSGAGMLVTLGRGNINITQQCSMDNSNWFTPSMTNGTALGSVYSGLNASKYIQFTPVAAPYARFQVKASDESIVMVDMVTAEE